MTTLSAIDIGYDATKCLATNGRRGHFPAIVGTEKRETFSLDEAKGATMAITMPDGQVWSVGRTALEQSAYSAGRRDPGWVLTEPYRVLACAALSELHHATATTSVVTGLPLEHFLAYADKLQETLAGQHRFRRNGRSWQTVTVDQVVAVTQPYGSLLDQAMGETGRILDNVWSTGTVAIADLGGNTLNLLVVDNLLEVGRWTQGDGLGLLKALDAIARDLHAAHPGITPQAREVSAWLARGAFPYQDQDLDIASYATPRLDPLVQMILNRFSEVWPEPGRYAAVLLTGGGALALGAALRSRMDGVYANVTVAQDAVFANVRGYLKLARRLWG